MSFLNDEGVEMVETVKDEELLEQEIQDCDRQYESYLEDRLGRYGY
ncbi:hypothetical protein [Leptolyngbya sp. NIES-2104]|nr:hypothetical protein [Leptolyngbya sp. NIES-2104]GAP99673.1 hypothetical protein NIES2104_62390 [Leptolyngbya sp. NIES-2104]